VKKRRKRKEYEKGNEKNIREEKGKKMRKEMKRI
jgi:hypothetical protein